MHHGDFTAQAVGLVPVVGDHQGCAAEGGNYVPHGLLQLPAQEAVQRGKGLVQHQDARAAQQNSGQGHSLLLPAGQLSGQTLFQPREIQGLQHFSDFCPPGFAPEPFVQTGLHILLHSHVGKQGVVLKQQAHPALLRRKIDASGAIEQGLSVQDNLALVRPLNPGNAPQSHGLSRAGAAQKGHGLVPRFQLNLKGEAAKGLSDIYRQ
ncbi:hypothetical protein SDC9_128658 [bioreactor metagenome]|uniref:Uncharacterized protein n=1 Tax=bioreactor metagenome TaxID=1076179 RepID=A0A645CYD8_9ZZZZ